MHMATGQGKAQWDQTCYLAEVAARAAGNEDTSWIQNPFRDKREREKFDLVLDGKESIKLLRQIAEGGSKGK